MPEMREAEWRKFVLERPRIGGRYMGADRAEECGARNGAPGELLVHVHPTRVRAATGITD